ncbi:protein MMS22-like [Onthophagus taurus]|uniref:protein MMS22-like n=1 Tax=Onthophagus taurus TaxID=166361 RepID=UPI0039BE4FD2
MASYLKCKLSSSSVRKEISDLEDLPETPIINNFHIQQNFENKNGKYVYVYGRNYVKELLILEGEVLFNRARKLWKHLENMILNETPIPPTTLNDIKEVVYLLLYTAQNLLNSKNSNTWDFQKNIYKFVELLKNSVLNVSKSHERLNTKFTPNIVTLKSEPICEYFHSYLGAKFLVLYIDNICDEDKQIVNIKNFMLDLISWSKNIYFLNKDSFIKTEPFLCSCVKRLWLYLIYNLKITQNKEKLFWKTFNELISNKKEEEEFIFWMVYHISVLYLYDDNGDFIGLSTNIEDNYELITKTLQSITLANPSENKLCNILKLLDPILTEIWVQDSKLEPFQILWEYFYKHLENVLNDTNVPKNLKETLEIIKTNPKSSQDPFLYYLNMLKNHLKMNPNHWNKMRGRIYSRLPPQKMNNYSNKAIFGISLLFIYLSEAGINESIEKIYSLLEGLSDDKQKSELLWIIYLTLMIISIQQNRDIKKISTILLSQTEEIANRREKFVLLKHFIKAIEIIMNSNQNYNLGQNILLGSWINPYMNSCTFTDLCNLLDTLTLLILQVENSGKWYEFKTAFIEYVLPALKRISVSNTVPSQVGEIAGKICLNSQEIIHTQIQYFCNPTINSKITYSFLITILRNNTFINFSTNEENLLISSWFRICILTSDESYKDLSPYIFNLPPIRNCLTIENFENDPYPAFVKALNAQMNLQVNISRLKDICEVCFGNIDQWLITLLSPYTSDTQITYLYTTISLFFYLCSPLLYHKSKSTCLFNRLISLLLLPTEILMGKPPSTNILKAIEKTWHLFLKGINTLKSPSQSDPYIDRTFKDLVIRYIPHFSPTNSPILNILDDQQITTIVFDKISTAYLLKSARSSEDNTHKALKTIQNVLENTKDVNKIILILEKISLGILEVIMFSNQKNLALDVIKSLISNGFYEQVQNKLQMGIQTATDRHLAFSTSNYFQLIGNLINIVPSSVRMTLPHIKKQISHVEKMRCVGFDNVLRQGLDRIEKALS